MVDAGTVVGATVEVAAANVVDVVAATTVCPGVLEDEEDDVEDELAPSCEGPDPPHAATPTKSAPTPTTAARRGLSRAPPVMDDGRCRQGRGGVLMPTSVTCVGCPVEGKLSPPSHDMAVGYLETVPTWRPTERGHPSASLYVGSLLRTANRPTHRIDHPADSVDRASGPDACPSTRYPIASQRPARSRVGKIGNRRRKLATIPSI